MGHYKRALVLGFKELSTDSVEGGPRGRRHRALTLFSPSGASGSVIHDPNREPEVLIVMGSLIPVSLPQAGKRVQGW